MRPLALVALLVLFAAPVLAQEPCQLEGVWEQVTATFDGEPTPETWRQMKIITATHFAFVSEEERGVTDLRTPADSLQAFRTMFSGGGTYTLKGNAYSEHLEYFRDPAYLGMSISFTCRTEGDRFWQSGMYPLLEDGEKVGEILLVEEYHRID